MTRKYGKGFALMEDEKYQMAYQEFSRLISHNQEDYTAYYYRGMIDFYYLKKNIPQTKNDFEVVIKKLPKYARFLYAPLTILSDLMNNPEQTIHYGMQAIRYPDLYKQPELALEVNFAISRAYFQQAETKDDYLKAMNHLDQCFNYSEDEIEELYLCKTDILLAMEDYQGVLDLLNDFLIKYPLRPEIYLKRAQALCAMAKAKDEETGSKDIDLLQESLDNFEMYENYRNDDPLAKFYQADVLRQLGRYQEAIDLYEFLRSQKWESDSPALLQDELTLEIMKTYDLSGDLMKAITYVKEYLEGNDSWRLEYALALMISEENPENLATVLPLMHHAYELSNRPLVAMGIVETYRRLGRLKECFGWLETMINRFPDEGRWYYYQADIAMKLDYPYEEVESYYRKAHEKGFLNELELCDMVIPLLDNPKSWFSSLHRHAKKIARQQISEGLLPDSVEIGSVHKLSVRYLYGLHGLKINLKRAHQYALFCQSVFPSDCCLNTNLGRTYELLGMHEEAFRHYFDAQARVENENYPLCHCSYGYLAHAYIQGIGTEVNLPLAKKLILQAIKSEGETADSSVLYLYAYLALKNELGFDLEEAVRLLEYKASFQRFEITRYQLLKQLKILLHQDVKEEIQMIKQSYPFDSILAQKYYRKHKDDEIYYPFFNHY